MKSFRLLVASTVLTCFALFPVVSLADEDLDVTMDVIDNLSDIEGVILEMSAVMDDDDDSLGGDDHDGDEDRDDRHDGDDEYGDDHDGVGEDDHEGNEDFADGADGEEDDGFEHDDEGRSDDDKMEPEDGHDEGDDGPR